MPLLLIVTLLAVVTPTVGAPLKSACWTKEPLQDRVSPLDSAVVTLGGATVRVCYGRPSARGRPIMGGLVPFDTPWRLGANEATSITVPFAAEIGDVKLAAGSYSLYAIPDKSSWQIVLNRTVERWGIPINANVRAQDVGTVRVSTEKLDHSVEMLTFTFSEPQGNSTDLIIEWETTRVRIPLKRSA